MKKTLTPNSQNPYSNVAEVELHYKWKVNPNDRPKITFSRQAYDVLMDVYNPMTIGHHETFYAMYLNRASRVLGVLKISDGGLTGTVVDVRFIFQAGLMLNACSVIVSHNHPSGNLEPSDADNRITRTIKDGCALLDMQLKDHVIVCPEHGYFSYADEGRL
jgi:DNA repair protein RadC